MWLTRTSRGAPQIQSEGQCWEKTEAVRAGHSRSGQRSGNCVPLPTGPSLEVSFLICFSFTTTASHNRQRQDCVKNQISIKITLSDTPQGRRNIKLQKLVELKNLRHRGCCCQKGPLTRLLLSWAVYSGRKESWDLTYHLHRLPLLGQTGNLVTPPTLAPPTRKKRGREAHSGWLNFWRMLCCLSPPSTSFHVVYTPQFCSSKPRITGHPV